MVVEQAGDDAAAFRFGAGAPAFEDLAAVPGECGVDASAHRPRRVRCGVVGAARYDDVGMLRGGDDTREWFSADLGDETRALIDVGRIR